MKTVGIIGTGLIGTSLGLSLTRAGIRVFLRDRDSDRASVAVALGAGQAWPADLRVDHVVLAVPPSAVAAILSDSQRLDLASSFSDVSSFKTRVIAECEGLNCDMTSFCPAHPIAGRELSGPAAAQADLFAERSWVLCPTPQTSELAEAHARAVAGAAGALIVRTSPTSHDTTMAAVSHLPQLVSSALAAGLRDLDGEQLKLVGQGMRDATRIADSDPELWASIGVGNAAMLLAALTQFRARLDAVAAALASAARAPVAAEAAHSAVRSLLVAGRTGRAQLPGKTGALPIDWSWVGVVLPDRPGELARLLARVGAVGVNVEDIRIEHSRQHPVGVVELAVAPGSGPQLVAALAAEGTVAHVV